MQCMTYISDVKIEYIGVRYVEFGTIELRIFYCIRLGSVIPDVSSIVCKLAKTDTLKKEVLSFSNLEQTER